MNSPFILITEDDADDRFLLQTAFAEKKYPERIEFVENGAELLKYLQNLAHHKQSFPRLILLDLNMPKKDGRETLKELKQNEVFRKIPVFVFTTTHNEQEMERCNQLGAHRYVVKPITFDGLLNVIDALHDFCANHTEQKRSE